MEIAPVFKILISLAMGAAIGLEREVHERTDKSPESSNIAMIGLRSFALITSLGAIAGILYTKYMGVFALISISVMLLLLIHYAFGSWMTKDTGVTTELAVIFSYIIGVLIGIGLFPIQLTIALTVVLILILSFKDKIKDLIDDIEKQEVIGFVSYALIALVILPFLPNESYTLGNIPGMRDFLKPFDIDLGKWSNIEIFNPFKTWMIVALITGIDVAGYVLERTIGRGKGLMVSSMVGGFISSTATTQSLAQQSNETTKINSLVAAAVLANFVSFFPPIFLVGTINPEFLIRSLPVFMTLIISSFVGGIFFFWLKDSRRSHTEDSQERASNTKIFALVPALKFAMLYLVIRIVSKIAVELFGQSGFLATSALGALTGIDAVMINTAELAGKAIDFKTGVLAFILINAVNLIAKTFYSFVQGKKEFAFKFGACMLVIILASLVGLFFV